MNRQVSLFTREWIEIYGLATANGCIIVSLFTREWIEIVRLTAFLPAVLSPSLRGSGLKSPVGHFPALLLCLPLYEGVD